MGLKRSHIISRYTESLYKIYAAKILEVDSRKSCVVCGMLLKSNDVGSTIRRVENAKIERGIDLSALDCAQCFATTVGSFITTCHNKKGCRVLYSSCYVRYKFYPFYFPLDPAKTGPSVGRISSVRLSP
ncbi:hypothetical protein ARALYDRAFT_894256 [Arabidopsis lyrata subsp. lyrata]|uniref:Gnk2-homologous domain-containing protein n=1 Tax=Arabidopsis lyrata subsp. lyrata TaxID=81972 RepID=D7KTL5_ARALL|nr:hypothetical protein ARALYDRAFT_894256 [Arabidopsis lyrata subsp. lyrata]